MLTIKKSNGEVIGQFSANQKNNTEVIIPVSEEGDGSGTPGFSGSITVVCEVQYDKTSHQLQQKTQVITVEKGLIKNVGETSDWIMIVGGQAKPIS